MSNNIKPSLESITTLYRITSELHKEIHGTDMLFSVDVGSKGYENEFNTIRQYYSSRAAALFDEGQLVVYFSGDDYVGRGSYGVISFTAEPNDDVLRDVEKKLNKRLEKLVDKHTRRKNAALYLKTALNRVKNISGTERK